MNKILYLLTILLVSMIMVGPVKSEDVSIMPVGTSNDVITPAPTNPPLLSITTDTQTVYVGELITVVFTVNAGSSCNPSPGGVCPTSETLVPVSEANILFQGAVTGSPGTTNAQGQRVTTINAVTIGTITVTASKSGYTDGSVTINVENRPKPPPSLEITTGTSTVNVGESKSITFTVMTDNTCNPSSGEACSSTATDQDEIPVSDVNVHLEGCGSETGKTDSNGNAVITVKATCAGIITVIASKSGYTDGKTTIEAKQATSTPEIEDKFRVGPTVRIRPLNDVISQDQDGLVELYMDNPSLNGVHLIVDSHISAPSGVHIYGQGFGDAGATGMVYGKFDIPPGSARTINIVIKVDKIGDFSVQFSGMYWPGNNKDAYQPISLTHPFRVIIPTQTIKVTASIPIIPTQTIKVTAPIPIIPTPINTPIQTIHTADSDTHVSLYGEKTDVTINEDILLRLSAVNIISKPMMTVQVILYPPSGMSVTGQEFVKSGAGIYTTTYKLNPGDSKDIEIKIKPNQIGDFNVKGVIVYYFGDEKSVAETIIKVLPIKVGDKKTTYEGMPDIIKWFLDLLDKILGPTEQKQ